MQLVTTWPEARSDGVSWREIERQVAEGRLRRRFRGVYVATGMDPWATELCAALTWARGSVASHRSAARLHRLEGFERAREIDLTVPPTHSPAGKRIQVHRSAIDPNDVDRVYGIPCTGVERTLEDLGAHATKAELAVAFESAWRREPRLRDFLQFRHALGPTHGRPGRSALRRVLADAALRRRPLASPAEVRVWRLCREARLPIPEVGFPVSHRDAEMNLDLAWVEHGVGLEVDSVEFHVSRFQEDARRSSRLAALGWKLLHVTPQAAEDDPSEVVGWIRDALQSSPRRRCAPRLVDWAPVPASVIRGLTA